MVIFGGVEVGESRIPQLPATGAAHPSPAVDHPGSSPVSLAWPVAGPALGQRAVKPVCGYWPPPP